MVVLVVVLLLLAVVQNLILFSRSIFEFFVVGYFDTKTSQTKTKNTNRMFFCIFCVRV